MYIQQCNDGSCCVTGMLTVISARPTWLSEPHFHYISLQRRRAGFIRSVAEKGPKEALPASCCWSQSPPVPPVIFLTQRRSPRHEPWFAHFYGRVRKKGHFPPSRFAGVRCHHSGLLKSSDCCCWSPRDCILLLVGPAPDPMSASPLP